MNAAEHKAAAETILEGLATRPMHGIDLDIATAQVHATLATIPDPTTPVLLCGACECDTFTCAGCGLLADR